MSSALSTSRVSGLEWIDQPTILRLKESITAAVEPAFSRTVLRDVRDPQFVRAHPVELAVDEIVSRHHATQPFDPYRPWKPVEPGIVHESEHQAGADGDVHPHRQFGMHPSIPVRSSGGGVDLADESREPFSTHCRGRGGAIR